MHNTVLTPSQIAITIAVIVIATVATRFIPYIFFPEGRKIPPFVQYLGRFLAPAVFGLLVVYCLRNVSVTSGTHGIPEALGVTATVATYVWKQNMMLSMLAGTALYMLLVQVVF